MHANLVSWLDKLKDTQLPALPHSAERLARMARDETANVPALASVAEKDPGLALALLRSTQALKQRRLTIPVTTVAHALMLLGITRVREVTTQVAVMDAVVNDAELAARLLALYTRANHAAVQAYDWAQLRMDLEPDEVQIAAQLHGLGEILLWLKAPALMAEMENRVQQHSGREQAERTVFGFTIGELTAELAMRWGLPELLRDSLLPGNAANPRVTGILLAQQLALAVEDGWYTAQATHALERIAAYLHLDFPEAVARVHRAAVAAAHAGEGMNAPQAAALLLEPTQQGSEAEANPTDFCVNPDPALFRRALQDLERRPGMDLASILALTLEAMHQGIGLSRVVFATPSRDRHLQGRHVLGGDDDAAFRDFRVPLAEGNLFAQLMHKPQAVWISEVNRDRFAPLLPADFLARANGEDFCAVSVFVGDRPVGLFYGDRRHCPCALDAEAYHQFKRLALAAAQAMDNSLRKSP